MALKRTQKVILWLGGIGAALAFFYPILFTSEQSFLVRDLLRHYAPAKFYWQSTLLREGQLPYWTSFVSGGLPYFADLSSSSLYPGNLVFLLFSRDHFFQAFNWYLATQAGLTFIAWTLLAQEYGLPPLLASMGGLSVTWSGLLMGTVSTPNLLITLPLVGFLLLCLKKMIRSLSLGNLWLLSAVLALCIYGGTPEYFYLFVPASVVVIGVTHGRRGLGSIFYLIVLCILGSAAQLFPALELFSRSERGTVGLALEMAEQWSFHPVRLLELLLPLPFGSYVPESDYWGNTFTTNPPHSMPIVFSLYLGALPLWFLLQSLAQNIRDWCKHLWLICFFVVLFILALGSLTPLYAMAFKYIPFWKMFRYPEKFALLEAWLLEALALGAASLFFRKAQYSRELFFYLKPALIMTLLVALGLRGVFYCGEPLHHSLLVAISFGIALQAIIGLSFWLFARDTLKAKSFLLVLAALLIVDAMQANIRLIWPVPTSVLEVPLVPEIQDSLIRRKQDLALGAPRRFTSGYLGPDQRWMPPSQMPYLQKLDNVSYELRIIGVRIIPNISTLHEIEDIASYAYGLFPPPTRLQLWQALRDQSDKLFDIFGVFYTPKQAPDSEINLVTRPQVLPYVFFPDHLEEAASFPEALNRILSPTFNPHKVSLVNQLERPFTKASSPELKIVSRDSRSMQVHLKGLVGGEYLQWNESYDPFWKAHWAGQESKALLTNTWAMSFKIPDNAKGEGDLVLRYQNPWIAIGAWLSTLWLVIGLVILLRHFFLRSAHPVG